MTNFHTAQLTNWTMDRAQPTFRRKFHISMANKPILFQFG